MMRRRTLGKSGEDYSKQYLTFEYEPKSNNILISGSNGSPVYVSLDLGATWIDWSGMSSDYYLYDIATNNPSHKILVKGTHGGYSSLLWIGDLSDYSSLPQKIYGNILSLCYGDNFIGQTTIPTGHNFMYAFGWKPGLYDASNLILPPMVTYRCYYGMFNYDTGLIRPPQLPAMTLASQCYKEMFRGCTALTTAPDLLATTMAIDSYDFMFYGCTSLNYIKVLATGLTELEGGTPFESFLEGGGASSGTIIVPTSEYGHWIESPGYYISAGIPNG